MVRFCVHRDEQNSGTLVAYRSLILDFVVMSGVHVMEIIKGYGEQADLACELSCINLDRSSLII